MIQSIQCDVHGEHGLQVVADRRVGCCRLLVEEVADKQAVVALEEVPGIMVEVGLDTEVEEVLGIVVEEVECILVELSMLHCRLVVVLQSVVAGRSAY